MFKLIDPFKTFDDNLQPYTMAAELHTEIPNMHSGVDERGFSLRSIGNRYIFCTPDLTQFKFDLTYFYTYMEEYNPTFNVFFGYDKKRRTGLGLMFVCSLGGGMKVSLIEVDRMRITRVSETELSSYSIGEEEKTHLHLALKGTKIEGDLDGHKFSFDVPETKGRIAIERSNFIGEFVMCDVSITSDDTFEEKTYIAEKTVEIPLRDGGDIPYLFSYEIKDIGGVLYLNTKLCGGTASRKVNREDRPGQYVAELDTLRSPFVKIRLGERVEKYYIFNDEKIIVDPNIFWECQKRIFGHPEFPIESTYVLNKAFADDSVYVSYGYEDLKCKGYFVQAGGPSEFMFDKDGKLLYEGDELGESVLELLSPEDKFATTLIPADAYKREEIIHHLATNHYFHIDEDINLTMSMKTKLDTKNISVKAEIRDVYDAETLEAFDVTPEISGWKFGYKEVSANIKTKPLKLGVYRVLFTVLYGDEVYRKFNKVFEVFDKDSGTSPAVASGLPYVFSMPNEQKWLMRNSFDLWNPKPSCDVGHFIACVTDTPIEAETRRTWEVIKPFGRQWFAWLDDRTVLDWSVESHMDVVKNADYLYIPAKTQAFPLRNDFYVARTYQNPVYREYLHEFMDLHPEFAEKLTYKKKGKSEFESTPIFDESGRTPVYTDFTYEDLESLMTVCHEEWMEYALSRILEDFKNQNEEIKKINPNFKRSAYGPFNQYVSPPLSYHTVKAFGNLPYESLAKDVYTGFAAFEDYPGSCAYQTYRGAFGVMTILLHCPDLKLYPEQYKGSPGGCIDGAVKFAHAPMGENNPPLYFNTTHAFEFVYNTPRKTEDGYAYWTSYGFHRPDHTPEMTNKLARDWGTVNRIKPAKPLKTTAMITEYYDSEDIYDGSIINYHGHTNIYNRSEEGHGYIYESLREAGLNAPFAMKLDTLSCLSADECDTLVIPTLKYASDKAKENIRKLYESGVSIFAVSDIDGLEDIFGVRKAEKTVNIDTLVRCDGEEEGIYPNDALFKYEADGADVILKSGNGMPVLLKKGNAVLLNASVSTLGHECSVATPAKSRKNVSRLLRDTFINVLRDISSPIAVGENVGVTMFEDKKGEKHMLCIDYSPYDNNPKKVKTAVVKLNAKIKEISCDRRHYTIYDENGYVSELRFPIRIHESVMFDLK
ncbi:MAG: hypothetical protein J5590_00755 [Clostridia bacterium]|nr:hypothetical protein [Clostridia bacterium]